jgi:hypothetical protein
MLIQYLIIFFSLLIIYQIYIYFSVREGLENGSSNNNNVKYQPYNTSDPAILSQQNAGNIMSLQTDISNCDCSGIKTQITNLSSQVQTMQNQLNSYSKQNIPPNYNPQEESKSINTNTSSD